MAQNKQKNGKIYPIDSAGAEFMRYNAQRQALHIRRVRQMHQRIIYGVMLMVVVVATITGIGNYSQMRAAEAQSVNLTKQVKKAQADNKQLTTLKNNLSNEDFAEQYVRQRYMYTKDGEIVFNLPSNQ